MVVSYDILIVAPPYRSIPFDGFGAIEKVTIQRGEVLDKLGFRVSYVIPEGSNIDFSTRSYFIKKVGARTSNSHISKVINIYKSFRLLKIVEDFDIILHESPLYDPLNFFNFRSIFGYKKRIDILHGNAMNAVRRNKPPLFEFPILGSLNKHTYQKLKENGWRTTYFPNGIVLPDSGKIVGTGDDYFVFIGRITPVKGVEKAVKFAKSSGKRLIIFGPVQDPEYYNRSIKPFIDNKTINFLGEQPWSTLESYLTGASALIFTSTFDDPQPTVLLEALSYGVPVIATVPGFYSGFFDICNENNSVVGKNVDELLHNYNRVFDLSRRQIYEETKKEWSWDNVARKYYMPVFDEIAHQ